LSCDLSRFSTVERSRRGHDRPPAWPEEAGLVGFTVASLRGVGSDIEHMPLRKPIDAVDNYAHAQFSRPLDTGAARDLAELCTFVVKPRL
jgi:hypothetical protein